jgi:hypothetical protein
VFDAHIRAWRQHLEVVEMRRLLAARRGLENEWRGHWLDYYERSQSMRERKWLT